MVMDFELEAWLMRILSQGHDSEKPQSRRKRFDRDQPDVDNEEIDASKTQSPFLAQDINGLMATTARPPHATSCGN
jgi:hypothetical protein